MSIHPDVAWSLIECRQQELIATAERRRRLGAARQQRRAAARVARRAPSVSERDTTPGAPGDDTLTTCAESAVASAR